MLAFTKKDMKPSFTPCSFSKRSLWRARSSPMAVRSISLKVVSKAAFCCACSSLSAMRRRRRVIGTRCSARAPGTATGPAAGAAAGATAGATSRATCAATSALEMRPSRPDPATAAGSTWFSSTRRRAAGPSFAADAAGATVAATGADFALFELLAGATTAAPSSKIASRSPLFTVAPGCTLNSLITPAAGAGTSSTTLSVSRSARLSSRLTASPGCLRQATNTASATDSGN